MPIADYGVWVAKPVRVSAERAEQDPESPHIHLFYDDGSGGPFDHARRASINVKSLSKLSELVFWLIPVFQHPIVDRLRGLAMGFHRIPSQAGGLALDYIRGNLIDFNQGRVLPHDKPGVRDDIIDYVMPELEAAIEQNAVIYLFGAPYDDRQGIHDVHMNQGSAGRFKPYNGVWQDGGMIIHFPAEERYAALFLAFASQAVHTDEVEGHGLPGSQTLAELLSHTPGEGEPTIPDDQRVAIIAALVNPAGSENQPGALGRPEMVYLLNRSAVGISLAGWSILNRNDEAHVLSGDIWLAPGECRPVTMGRIPLSNNGGLLSLLDENGYKVDGVSYTKEQAEREDHLIIFR
jgi:uncharacterized protein YukJ